MRQLAQVWTEFETRLHSVPIVAKMEQGRMTLQDYRDLLFKDSNTWYSGSPYLGYKGPLPSTVQTQNACGEQYFPWHSHALNEFTNFEAGFGGMASLMRVDPPDGCTSFPKADASCSAMCCSA